MKGANPLLPWTPASMSGPAVGHCKCKCTTRSQGYAERGSEAGVSTSDSLSLQVCCKHGAIRYVPV